mmetsp:Transcript_9801/g.11300  ORF Transcript_9801/g.11300 Transcript_9801/m.11300 type:complete len:102 (-) Transcript_9801:273-578(-)
MGLKCKSNHQLYSVLGLEAGGTDPRAKASESLTRTPAAPPVHANIGQSHSIASLFTPPTTPGFTENADSDSSSTAPAGTIAPGQATTTRSLTATCLALVTT